MGGKLLSSFFSPSGINLWRIIGTYEATIAEASHVFNFSAIDFDNDSMLVMEIDGGATLALRLQMRINAVATGVYFTEGREITSGVETLIDLNSQTALEIASATLIAGADSAFQGLCEIFLNKAGGGTEEVGVKSSMNGLSTGVDSELKSRMFGSAQANISSVEVLTSTSTWKIGTRITLYRVRRQ